MISYLQGKITYKSPTYIIVEANGIGYHVNISLNTYSQIEKIENVKILTHLQVKEDSHTLYGFAAEVERSLFRLLISVSGIGTNTARLILSGMQPDEVRSAIIGEDDRAFSAIKGIGPKTAKRLILDLKDKVLKDAGDEPLQIPSKDNTMRDEALSALVALGFNKIQVQKALKKVFRDQADLKTVEQVIKAALKQLS